MSERTPQQRLLQRWQQTEDDELLYAADPGYGTVEEAVHAAMASARRYAEARQRQDPSVPLHSPGEEGEVSWP